MRTLAHDLINTNPVLLKGKKAGTDLNKITYYYGCREKRK
jgi:hypothetical protein